MGTARLTQFPSRALQDPRLTPADVKVLAVLGCTNHEEGWTFLSYGEIARLGNLGRSTVIEALKKLAATGYVQMRRWRRDDAGHDANSYRVCFDLPDLVLEPPSPEFGQGTVQSVAEGDVTQHLVAEVPLPVEFPTADLVTAAAAAYPHYDLAMVVAQFRAFHAARRTRARNVANPPPGLSNTWQARWLSWLKRAEKDHDQQRRGAGSGVERLDHHRQSVARLAGAARRAGFSDAN